MDLDRELESLAQDTPPEFGEGAAENVITKVADHKDLLSEYVDDYKPASTVAELEAQVHQARAVGADSVEVTPDMFRFYCGPDDGKNANWSSKYFHYKSVKAYLVGKVAEANREARLTIEQKIFGGG